MIRRKRNPSMCARERNGRGPPGRRGGPSGPFRSKSVPEVMIFTSILFAAGLRASGAESCGAPCGPRPVKIIAADGAECIEHLATEEQARLLSALHRSRIDFRQAH